MGRPGFWSWPTRWRKSLPIGLMIGGLVIAILLVVQRANGLVEWLDTAIVGKSEAELEPPQTWRACLHFLGCSGSSLKSPA